MVNSIGPSDTLKGVSGCSVEPEPMAGRGVTHVCGLL